MNKFLKEKVQTKQTSREKNELTFPISVIFAINLFQAML